MPDKCGKYPTVIYRKPYVDSDEMIFVGILSLRFAYESEGTAFGANDGKGRNSEKFPKDAYVKKENGYEI